MKLNPIGIMSRYLYEDKVRLLIEMNGGMCSIQLHIERLVELRAAINRYMEAELYVNLEWLSEYNDILNELGVKQNPFSKETRYVL